MQTKRDRGQRLWDEARGEPSEALPGPATASGADLLRGTLRYDQESGNWYLGEVNMTPHLARYRDHEVMVVIAPLDRAEPRQEPRLVCEICGCPLDDMGDCPHCQLHFVQAAHWHREQVRRERLFAEIDRVVEERWRD
jgi:hypothetical protein